MRHSEHVVTSAQGRHGTARARRINAELLFSFFIYENGIIVDSRPGVD
jgi:hypothetical protein